MSDLKDRVGVLTGGNANLIPNAGDLITGDGNQTVYLRGDGVADGLVLTKDSTVEEGMSWQVGGGGGGITNVTGSDGVTVTTPGLGLRNATNDLVTGVDVAQLNVDSLGAASIDTVTQILLTAGTNLIGETVAGDIIFNTPTARNLTLSVNSQETRVVMTDGILIDATNDGSAAAAIGEIFLIAATEINLQSGNNEDINLTAPGTGDVTVAATGGDVNLSSGDDFGVSAGGSVLILSQSENLTVQAGSVGGTGEVRIQPGTTSATRTFAIWDGDGDGQQARTGVTPVGGVVVDAEVRAALSVLCDYLEAWGWLAPLP